MVVDVENGSVFVDIQFNGSVKATKRACIYALLSTASWVMSKPDTEHRGQTAIGVGSPPPPVGPQKSFILSIDSVKVTKIDAEKPSPHTVPSPASNE